MKRKYFYSTLIFSITITLLFFSKKFASAENFYQAVVTSASSDECRYALDIVFLIDQSGSMSGHTPNNDPANDPLGQRINAAKYALDWLASNKLGLCPTAIHRIGVISWGSNTVIDLPLTKINPVSQNDWNSISTNLANKIESRDLDGTDPALGFREAAIMLKSAPPIGDLPRKKVIIHLTDGKACVATKGCLPSGDGMDHEAYNRQLLALVEDNFKFSDALNAQDRALKLAAQVSGGLDRIPAEERNRIYIDYPVSAEDLANSVYIWVVAMNNATPYLNIDGATLKQISETHGGELKPLLQNLIEVPMMFNDILSWLAGITPEILSCGNLAVDPYLSGAILDVYKVGEGYEVKISKEDVNKSITGGQGDTEYFGMVEYRVYGAIEHYRFEKPPAGLWKIDASDCRGIQVSFIPFHAKLQLIEPNSVLPVYNRDGETSDPNHPFYLHYKITNPEGNITLDLDPAYPIEISAIVTDPAGNKTTLQLEFKEDGEWISTSPLPVDKIGSYGLVVSGIAPCVRNPDDPNRCPAGKFEVFRDDQGKYLVGDVTLFDFKILSPQENEVIPLHGKIWPDKLALQPVAVRVQMVDANGEPLPATTVLVGALEDAFEATLTAGEDSHTIKLIPDASDASLFTTQFYQPARTGDHILSVKLVSDYKYFDYSPAKKEVNVKFSRKDPLWQNPAVYYGMASLLILLLLALIIKLIYDHANQVRGTLNILDVTNSQAKSLPLKRKKRVEVFKGGLPCEFKKITVRNAVSLGGKRVVTVTFYPAKGKKIVRNLTDGSAEVGVSVSCRANYVWGGHVGPQKRKTVVRRK